MSSACQRRFNSTTAVRIGPGLSASASSCVQDRIGPLSLAAAIVDRVDALSRVAGDAVVPVLGRVGEPAQALRRLHAFRRRHPRLGVAGGERQLDQRVFIADAGDGRAAAFGICRAAGDVRAHRIGARLRVEEGARGAAVGRIGKHAGERGRERRRAPRRRSRRARRRRARRDLRSARRQRCALPARGRWPRAARAPRRRVPIPPRRAAAATPPRARAGPVGKTVE